MAEFFVMSHINKIPCRTIIDNGAIEEKLIAEVEDLFSQTVQAPSPSIVI